MMAFEGDFKLAFDLIIENLKAHPERAHRSVILIASGSEEKWTYADVKADRWSQNVYEPGLRELSSLGVPIVCAAGNEANDPARQNIDSLPAAYQDDDTPIINVAAAAFDGNRLSMSQHGPQLTMYAPGDQLESQPVDDITVGRNSGSSVGMYRCPRNLAI
jgi:hypothetical protein